ncbi:MAG: DUF423 domain-containing protein [Burkholderiaceae bacterium]|nr:DUF423 domain-containing protein [Burkholderiaceae bacterium]
MIDRSLAIVAALNMFAAVGAGAFGAHGLKRILSAEMLSVWQTAVTYQMMHALGMLTLAVVTRRMDSTWLTVAGWTMLVGIVLFCGSLYALATTGLRWLGPITPIGGAAFLLAWVMVAWGCWRAAPLNAG